MTEFNLDMTPGGRPPIIHASQGDIGRAFQANLFYNGEPMALNNSGFGSLTEDEENVVSARIRGKKPDHTVFELSLSVVYSASYVRFQTTEQMTIVSGPVVCELVLKDSGNTIASANFILSVEPAAYDPDALSESDVIGLQGLILSTVGDWWEDTWDNTMIHTYDLVAGAVTWEKLAAAVQNRITGTETAVSNLESSVSESETGLSDLETRLKSGKQADANLHLGFYLDDDGDVCQV